MSFDWTESDVIDLLSEGGRSGVYHQITKVVEDWIAGGA